MNVWRCLGIFLFLAALTCFVGARLPAFAGGDKAQKGDTKDQKGDEKDKKKGDEKDKKKGDEKDKSKGDEKDKKGEKKPEPPKGGSDTLPKFTAFNPGAKAFYQVVATETTQDMKVMGQEVRQQQKQTFYIKWTPAEKADNGDFVVEQQVVAIEMNIDIGGNKIEFNSAPTSKQQPKNPMTDFFKALMEQKLKFIISPDMKVKDIKGREEFIKSLSETNPAIRTLLDTIMSDAALKKMAEPTWWAVPKKTTAGETWSDTSTLVLGPIGTYDTTFKFTYEGKTNNIDKVKIDADLKYTAPPKDKTGLPFTIKDATLTGKSTFGEAYFDRDKGRIEKSKLVMKIEGTLSIEVGNVVTPIELKQEQTSSTKTLDELPPGLVQKKQ